MAKKMTMGVIVGNRGFFPDALAKSGREEIMRALEKAGMGCVVLGPDQSKYGAVETHDEAKRCAALFREHRHEIDGVIVTLPNFGDERAVADTLRMADLGVPVLVQASPDAAENMTAAHRRDSFCGKISVCNNLRQYRIPFSLTALHTVHPEAPQFGRVVVEEACVAVGVAQGLIVVRAPPVRLVERRVVDALVDDAFVARMLFHRHRQPLRVAIDQDACAVLVVAALELHMVEHDEQVGTDHPVEVAEPGQEVGLMQGDDHLAFSPEAADAALVEMSA